MTTVICGFCNNNKFLSDGPGTIELRDSRSRHVLAVGFHTLLCRQCNKFVPAIANHKLTASDFHDEIRGIISLLKGREFPKSKGDPDFNECMYFLRTVKNILRRSRRAWLPSQSRQQKSMLIGTCFCRLRHQKSILVKA